MFSVKDCMYVCAGCLDCNRWNLLIEVPQQVSSFVKCRTALLQCPFISYHLSIVDYIYIFEPVTKFKAWPLWRWRSVDAFYCGETCSWNIATGSDCHCQYNCLTLRSLPALCYTSSLWTGQPSSFHSSILL